MSASKPQLSTVNHASWLPALQLATEEVFETMLGSQLKPYSAASGEGLEVTAMVGLAGAMCGVLTICCSTKAGIRMASKMLGGESESAASQSWDALGEICNMVAGNFKNKIPGMGDGCVLSVPTVITGEDYDCHSLGESDTLKTSFLFEAEMVIIALEIKI